MRIERVEQKLSVLPLLAFWEQTRQGDLQYTVLIDNLNSVYNTGGCQVIAFADGGAGIYQMPQPAGNFLCSQGGISG